MNINNLGKYLQLLLDQSGLNATDIERRCHKKITNSYIGRITRGEVTNLTVETIVALAEGFGVDPHELFSIACGKPPQGANRYTTDPLLLLDTMQKLVLNPDLLDVVQVLVRLEPEHRAALLSSIKSISERDSKKKKKPRKKSTSSLKKP
jgi:transcriptional regulator with XRE-family HTH domain